MCRLGRRGAVRGAQGIWSCLGLRFLRLCCPVDAATRAHCSQPSEIWTSCPIRKAYLSHCYDFYPTHHGTFQLRLKSPHRWCMSSTPLHVHSLRAPRQAAVLVRISPMLFSRPTSIPSQPSPTQLSKPSSHPASTLQNSIIAMTDNRSSQPCVATNS